MPAAPSISVLGPLFRFFIFCNQNIAILYKGKSIVKQIQNRKRLEPRSTGIHTMIINAPQHPIKHRHNHKNNQKHHRNRFQYPYADSALHSHIALYKQMPGIRHDNVHQQKCKCNDPKCPYTSSFCKKAFYKKGIQRYI